MNKGDRVFHYYLGHGIIVHDLKDLIEGMVRVKFDLDPPIRYNGGNNPCAVFIGSLKREDLTVKIEFKTPKGFKPRKGIVFKDKK